VSGFTQMYTTDNELRDTARILKSFIENQDTDPSLQKTKALLAYFASENTTASEGFTSAGIVALGLAAVVAVVAAAYLTGGLAAGALGFGEGAGLAAAGTAAASGVAGATAAAATIAAAGEVGGIAAGITGWLYIIPVTKTALTFLAGKGLIAASSAGIAGIIGGIYGAGWCGNTLDDYSDDYLEFKAALTSRDTVGGMGELRGEIEDVDDYGSSETGNIKRALINALEKIEMSNASSNIRSKVLADLKAAEGGSGAVVGGR